MPPKNLEVAARLAREGREFSYALATDARRAAIHGPSGSGKTTLLRLLAGLEPRARGVVRFGGECWQDDAAGVFRPAHERSVGWVPQDALLFPHLSVRENILFSPRATPADARGLAGWLGLEGLLDRSPRALSGGERQRVALARALASRPRLLLLDEAFCALHRALKARLLPELAARCEARGVTALLVTHQAEDAALFGCDASFSETASAAEAGAACPDTSTRSREPSRAESGWAGT